jgi:hypothetical protein
MQVVEERRAWTTPAIRERCRNLRRSLTARGWDAAELTAYWPGGTENPGRARGAWIFCYANLVGMLRVADSRVAADPVALDQAVAEALAATPRLVALASGETRTVYPKSYHALRWLDALDRSLIDAATLAAQAEAADVPEQVKLATLAPLVESLAVRLWAWVLTAGGADGPAGLPFDDDAAAPDPPAWTRALTPMDLLQLAQAHIAVNATRLRTITDGFPSATRGATRLSLSGFLGTAAQELAVRPMELLRRWSLGEVFAQSVTAAQAAREARERAEAEVRATRSG